MTTAPPLPLHTERLLLRTAREDDLDQFLDYWGDPAVTAYLPFDALDRAGAQERLGRFLANTAPAAFDDALSLVIELDGRAIGDLMLRLKEGEPPSVAELGWILHPVYSGRGIATEAGTALIDLAFGHYSCHRVMAQLDPRNDASARLCERMGMTKEAHLRQDWWGKGEWSDTAVYGLLRSERRGSGKYVTISP